MKFEKTVDRIFMLIGIGAGALVLFIGAGVPLLWALSGVAD